MNSLNDSATGLTDSNPDGSEADSFLPGPCHDSLTDPARLAAVRRSMLLDTPPEIAFDRLSRLAAHILAAPVALISLLDESRVFYKSSFGMGDAGAPREIPLAQSFCQHHVKPDQPLVIEDARNHPLFSDHPAVAAFDIGSYIGMPLIDSAGYWVGMLCVLDHQPRTWSTSQKATLQDLAATVITEIELRSAARDACFAQAQTEILLESATDGFFALDSDWRVTRVNAHGEQLLGRNAVELLGNTIWELYPALLGTVVETEYRAAMRDRLTVAFDNYYAPWDRWFGIKASPAQDGGLAVFFHEITALKQAEAQASQTAAQLRMITDTLPALISYIDRDGCYRHNNQAYETWFGCSRSRITGRLVSDVLGEPAWLAVKSYVEAALAGQTINYEKKVAFPSGERWINATYTPSLDPQGQVAGIAVLVHDITGQKRLEAKLLESEERYRTLFNTIDDGFCIIEILFDAAEQVVDYRFIEINAAFEQQSGLTNVVGRTIRELVSSYESYRLEIYGKVADTGASVRFEDYVASLNCWFEVCAYRVEPASSRKVAILFKDITARKQVEATLTESEKRFRTLADNMSQFAWMTDPTGAIFWYNQRWFDYTGTTLEEMQGWDWQQVHHPDHRQRVAEKFKSCVVAGEVWEDAFPLRGKDGAYRWFLSRALPIRDADGNISGWFGTNTDITEQRNTELSLRENKQRLDYALSAARMVAWDWNLLTGVHIRSDNAGALLELPTSSMEGLLQKVHADDRASLENTLQNARNGSAGYETEFRLVMDDGAVRWIADTAQLVPDAQGVASHLTGVMMDITARKQLDSALKASHERMNLVVEASELGVWNIELPLDRLNWNDRLKQHFGLPPDAEVTIDIFYQRLHPEDRERTRQAIHAALERRSRFETDYRTISPDGQLRWIRAYGRVFYDQQGQPVRFDGVTLDITERKSEEVRNAFLGSLQDTIRSLPLPADVLQEVVSATCRHLGASRCLFGEVDPAQLSLCIKYDYCSGVSSIAGNHRLLDFGAEVVASVKRGETLVVCDASQDQRIAADILKAYQAIEVASGITVPLIKDGHAVAILSVQCAWPRRWTEAETGLLQTIAERTWQALQRAQAEQELLISEDRLRRQLQYTNAITDSLGEGLYVLDAEGRVTFMNPAAERMLGWGQDELLGRELHPIIHYQRADGSLLPMEDCPILEVLRTGTGGKTREDVFTRRDGSLFPIYHTNTPILSAGRVIGLVNTFHDITERLQNEAALRESEARFRMLTDSSPMLVWLTDQNAACTYFNKPWLEFTGRRLEQELNQGWVDCVHPEDRERERAAFQTACEAKQAFSFEFRLRRHDGEYRWLLATGVPLLSGDGAFNGYIGCCLDITDRKESEMALQTLAAQLARSNRELQDFTSVASHDLQEPLRKIMTFGDRLHATAGDALHPQARDYLDRMQAAARRMQSLITDLLLLSRVTSTEQSFLQVSLDGVAHAVVSDLSTPIEESGGRVEISHLGAINADPTQMRQLLQNLIGNALKFRRPDTPPLVKVQGKIRVEQACKSSDPPKVFYELTVEDNGIGFEQHYAERIFIVFERLHGRNEYAGTGIGLAICRKIAERHGGAIKAESLPGKGTRFIVTLAVHDLPQQQPDA